MNVIDRCWRRDPQWRSHRAQLANCSIGYAGKMMNNIGSDLIHYEVIDPTDDPINPKPEIWIDHNTLQDCEDGLLDVTRGSTDVTVSNNWFRNQDKVMLLGHDDGYIRDQNMKVTVVYNHFGPNCNQHNLYQGWMQYAIGGSMGPSLKSQSNLFIAPESGNKEVTWRKGNSENGNMWEFHSIGDAFENGASFTVTKGGRVPKPNYSEEQYFKVLDAKSVRFLTRSSGVL
ncbi:hypothetical protein Ahy_B09g095633 isoform I [Arachis hypogaea]|uniref:Pectate lyase domain-containing protein n=1 Tax=Arachis hypogaea TaxID=3818 RepID=A0A444XFC9_ARAHY|nr:hypothetical protein Ahy_B09g095633 isoform I [Arachis hypogaea]